MSLRQTCQEDECWKLLGKRIVAVLWSHGILPTAEVSKVFKATVPKSPHCFSLLYADASDWLICPTSSLHNIEPKKTKHFSANTQHTQMATFPRVAMSSEQNPPNCPSKLAQLYYEGSPGKVKIAFMGVKYFFLLAGFLFYNSHSRGLNITLLGSLKPAWKTTRGNSVKVAQSRGKTADLATLTCSRFGPFKTRFLSYWCVFINGDQIF